MVLFLSLMLAGAPVASSLARLDAIKAEEKAIKKELKAQGIVIKGKKAYRLVPLENPDVTPHDRVPTEGVPVRSR